MTGDECVGFTGLDSRIGVPRGDYLISYENRLPVPRPFFKPGANS